MMLQRPLGRSGLLLSVIGFGSAQLRQLPRRQAVDTLIAAFEQGVNFVHTAPDYEGADDAIAEAIAAVGRPIVVGSQGFGTITHFEHLFETTCQKFGSSRLELFGIACINDRERDGENVWGPGGMVEFLAEKKRQGRLTATFCTTHGSPEYVRKLIQSGAFDGIMLAYNPLGYHLLTQKMPDPDAQERLADVPELFALAARKGVGLIVMKALAGGLLATPKALTPYDEGLLPPAGLSASTVLRYLLDRHPEITSLAPGTTSPEEARENALAGHGPLVVTPAEKADVAAAVARVKAGACSRCGECDGSCSQNLHISWLLRAAYVENHRLMPFETQPHLRYFDLHPERFTALCADCTQVTCRCPYGIDIPRDIGRVHGLMVDLLRRGRAVASPKVPEPRAPYAAALAGWDRDEVERPGWIPACRLSLQNTGSASWVMPPPYPFVSLEVTEHGEPRHELALRSDIGPDMPCMFAFPLAIGAPTDGFRLALLVRDRDSHEITHRIELGGIPESAGSPYALSYRGHTIQATLGRGAACEAEVEIRNDSVVPWRCDDPVPDTLHLAVWTDGEYAGGGRLPAVVEPGQSVRVPVTFTMPDRLGAVLVKLDMVHQNVAFFESRGVAPLRLRVVAGGAVSGRIGAPDPTGPTGLAPEWPEYDAAYLAHRLPASVPPGARLGVWVRLENTGSFTWDVNTIGGARQISVAAHINDRFAGGVALLQPVPPGGRADVHLAMEAPTRAGNYEVEIGLVHEGVAFFKARGVAPLMAPLKVVGKSVAEGSRAFEVMRERNSWFYQPSSGITVAADGGSYPAMVTRARGCHLWDGTGRRVIDYTMGWGCALLGHAYEPVQKAVRAALDDGATVPMPYPLEAEVTEMLCADIPCAESVVFGKNGSDVCTVAVRLARTITGRTTVLHCGWHGWQDWCIESLGIAATGVPAPPHPRTHRFRFNDLADFQRLLGLYGHDLAAVMLEPSGPAGEQPYGVGGDVQPDFLRHVAEQARAAGALVIFDEIITGFRVPGGSVQAATGVIPDLACFGKALANGLPLAALVGRRDVFGAMPRAFYGPTFKGELYALAAARAALLAYRDKPVAKTVDRAGRRLKGTLERLIRDMDIPAVVHGPNFRFGVFFQDPDPHRQLVLKTLYMQELLKGGVVPYNTLMLPSFAHDDAALRETEAVCTRALERIRRALDAGDLHAVLEIPLVVR